MIFKHIFNRLIFVLSKKLIVLSRILRIQEIEIEKKLIQLKKTEKILDFVSNKRRKKIYYFRIDKRLFLKFNSCFLRR